MYVSGGEKPPKSGGEPNQGEPRTKKCLRNAGPLSWLMAKTVGGDQCAALLVAAVDEFEQQVGVAVGIGQVADLVDDQQARGGVVAQAAAQGRVTVDGGQFAEQLACGGEQHGGPVDEGLVGDVARQHRLADAAGPDEYAVGGLLEEVEGHQRLDGGAVDARGPAPVEVAQRLEAPDVRLLQAALQAAAGPLPLLPAQQLGDPGFGGDLLPMGQQAMEAQGLGALAQGFNRVHGRPPQVDRRLVARPRVGRRCRAGGVGR